MSEEVVYLGRTIPKLGFRAFVFGYDGKKRLVDSWDDFEAHVSSDEWWPTEKDVPKKRVRKNQDE